MSDPQLDLSALSDTTTAPVLDLSALEASPLDLKGLDAPEPAHGFGSSFIAGAKQGFHELGASGAGTIERLQDPGDPLKKFAADAADRLSADAAKYAPSAELAKQPWYERLRNPDYLGNLLGNVAVQSAPSLAGAAVGGVLGGPAGAAAGMMGVTYFQQAGSSYRDAYERYKSDGLDEKAAHEKAYTDSGIAGLVSGAVNALAIPASLVAPFTSTLKNLALNYVLNVAVDTGDQATQNVVAKATYNPEQELTQGIPEAVVGSAALGAGETIGTLKGAISSKPTQAPPAPPPMTPAEPSTPTVAPILQAGSVDDAITAAQKTVDSPPISDTKSLDEFIQHQTLEGTTNALHATWLGEKSAHQSLLETVFRDYVPEPGEAPPLTKDERGNTFFAGSPLEALHPQELPVSTGPDEGLSQQKYDVLNAIASTFGKHVVVFRRESESSLPDGVVHRSQAPSTIFLASKTKDADLFSVFAHEAVHLMEGTAFHEALVDAVWGMKTPEFKQLAIDRHGDLPHAQLLQEVVADISGTELHKPDVWHKVYTNLQERYGDEKAKTEVLGFIDTLKQMIQKVTDLIASKPWSTGFGAQKKTLAEQYVTDLTKVHDALAEGVANALYQARSTPKPGEQTTLSLSKASESREILHPEAVLAFTDLAKQQRGAPESAMLKVQEAVGGGVMNPVVEHVGDLIHRMTESSAYGEPQRQNVLQKIERSINALTHAYGFEKEHHENLSNNARYGNRPVAEVRAAVESALLAYAKEHRKLPTYNLPQWLAKQAAIAVGEQRFDDAIAHLKELKQLASSKDFAQQAFAITREKGKLAKYARPIHAKLIGTQQSGTPTIPDFDLYNLEQAIPGHPVGSTVARETIEAAGYRPQPTDFVTKSELATKKSERSTSEVDTKVDKSSKSLNNPDTEGKAQEEYDYASTQIDLAPALAKKVLALGEQIKTEDLAEKGREDDPHITVLYGLHSADPKPASALLRGQAPISATIGDLDLFETDDGDVIVLKVESPSLVAMNEKIGGALENTTERAYRPHITVAYVKPGLGKGYVESLRNTVKGQLVKADSVSFSNKKGDKTQIPLGRTQASRTVALEHYSKKEGLREISPKFHGTGQIGAERTRMANEGKDYLPRSYFYRAGAKPEARFKGLTKYTANVPEDRLADLATLKGTPTEREQAAKKAGYLGFYNSESAMPEAVALFESVKVGGPQFSQAGTSRAYDAVQHDIDDAETVLDKAGVNISHLYDASNPQTAILAGHEDWKPMPPHLEALYHERDAIEQQDRQDFLEKTVADSGLSDAEALPALKALSLEQGGVPTHFSEVLREWGHSTTRNLEKLYNHFAEKKYPDLEMHYAQFRWGGTAEKPVMTAGTARGGRPLDREILNKVESLYNAVGENIGNPPISLRTSKALEGPQFSPATPFFSQLQRTLAEKMPAKALKEQVRNILKSPGVKEDEIKWSGIPDYLDAQTGPIDKHNLLAWLANNEVQVNEVVKTDSRTEEFPHEKFVELNRLLREADYLGFDSANEARIAIVEHPDWERRWPVDDVPGLFELANEYLDVQNGRRDNQTKFGDRDLKLPGGEDYTELLLTLPVRTYADKSVPTREENFNSTHFDEPNIVAHVRFDTRRDGAGANVLFLEEVQSDWHEQGREKGYRTEELNRHKTDLDTQISNIQNQPEKALRDITIVKEYERLLNERSRVGKEIDKAVPAAPFSKSWPELVMKRMIRWAAEHNYDRLAWTTGAQQNKRYGLAKVVRSIDWLPNKLIPGTKNLVIRLSNAQTLSLHLKASGVLEGAMTGLDGHTLQEAVGKDVAEKILSTDEGQLAGDGLRIGGSGMKYFYDQMLPRFMEKYLKRFGTTVDAVQIETTPPDGRRIPNMALEKNQPNVETVHSIRLTPEMKDSVLNQGQPQFSPARNVPPTYPVSQPGKLDRFIRLLSDKNIDLRRFVEDLTSFGHTVPEPLNPVLAEEMYQKRDEQRAKDFTNDELRPLTERMRLAKVSLAQLDDYLHARHVIVDQVNARLKAMNPTLANNDALSGMTDADAQAILAKAPSVMASLATDVDQIVDTTRGLMVDYGLEKQERINEWKQQYQAYVPLHREGFDDQGHPTGTGKSIRGSTVGQRGGSNLAVQNILANIAQERDQIITRGEKNRVTQAMAGLLMIHPNPAFATLDKPAPITVTNPVTGLPMTVPGNLAKYEVPTIRRFDKASGTMKSYPDPAYKGRDNVVNFRVKGVDYAIVFNEQSERAKEVATAFKNLGTPALSGIMKVVAPYTRYLAAINTQYNPIFGIVNFVRDAQFAMLTLASTPLQGKQLTVLKNAVAAMKGIYQDAREVRMGSNAVSPIARLWQRFEHVGGPTGYRDLFLTSTDRAKELERMLDPSTKAAFRSAGSSLRALRPTEALQTLGKRVEETGFMGLLSDYNLMMENAIRLGVFKTAVENGMSDLQAASYAKNITVNFNKKGQIGAQMGSLYAFFNANVQGSARIAETLFERTPTGVKLSSLGKKIVAGGILVGVLQTFLLAMAGFDDDDPPEFVKQKNFIIPMPGTTKGYAMIPMPLGFNLLPNVGRIAAETVQNGIQGKPLKLMAKGADLIGTLYNALSPVGGSGGIVQELSPTVIDPFVALKTNTDWTGKSIYKEDISHLDPTPGRSRAHDTATAWAKGLSTAINWATGGTDYTPGVASPTPDAIDYLISAATGGVGREVAKGEQVAESLITGEELPTHKIPLVGRFYGSATGSSAIRAKFYGHVLESNIAYNEFEGRAKHHEEFSDYIKTHPEARFAKAAITVQKDLGLLQKQKQLMLDRGAGRDAIRMQEERITGLMSRFNALVEKAQNP